MFKTIIFDMDGTLLDSNPLVLKIYQTLTQTYKPNIPLKTFSETDLLQKSYPEILSLLYGDDIKIYIDKVFEIHQSLALDYLKLYPDTHDTLEYFQSKGIKLYLFTSELRNIAITEITGLSIYHFFEGIIAFEDVSRPKPDPEGILQLILKKKLHKSEVLLVGDSPSDGKAAKEAGIQSIYMNWHNDTSKAVYFDRTFNHFDELIQFVDDFEPAAKLKFKKDGSFKLLQLTDLHLMNDTKDIKTKHLIKTMISRHKPDLVVLTGDQTMSKDSPKLYEDLTKWMDAQKKPWAFVFGNHDTDEEIPYEALLLNTIGSTHLIFKKGNPKYGVGNYFIELRHNRQTKSLLFLMDSHKEAYYMINEKPTWGYGAIKDDQLEWLNKIVEQYHYPYEEITSNYVFAHIPPYLFGQIKKESTLYKGVFNETPCTPPVDSKLLDVFSKNNVKSLFVGHDHYNDFEFMRDNVLFGYGRVSGYYDYGAKGFKRGARIFTLHEDGTFETSIDLM